MGVVRRKESKKESNLSFTLFVFFLVILVFLVIPYEYKGKPINYLSERGIYTVHSQTEIDRYSYLILENEFDKKPKTYKVIYWKLRNENDESIISTLPERFKIKRGTVTYWKGTKTIKVYFIIPKK